MLNEVNKINNVLKLVRQYHRLNQKQTAKKLGISPSYLSEIETGLKEPSLSILDKYHKIFGIPKASLLMIAESLENGKTKSISSKAIKILEWVAN